MEGGRSAYTLDYEVSEAYSVKGPQERTGPQERKGSAEDRGFVESRPAFSKRSLLAAPEEEEEEEVVEEEVEEEEGPLGEQDLKEAYIQLVRGEQEWQDGCIYRGEFGLDVKLGYGEFSWPTGELYRGQFYRDHRHGLGTYTWPDGSSFTGTFYLSHREGYGTMYMKTSLFQGLYKADERFGPGIETHPDGSQDVGLWFRQHLIKLCTAVSGGFTVDSRPELSGFCTRVPARIRLSDGEAMGWGLHEGQDPFFYEFKRFLLNDDLTLPPEMFVYSTDSGHLPMTRSFRKELDARIFANDIPPFVEDGEPWFVANETPLLVRIQEHAYRFRNKKAHSSWNMGAILEGDREGFACSGPKERFSQEMILKAEEGDHDWIQGVLRDNFASADVADSKGYTALAAAAIHCHCDVVNLLLDFGADVNKCTDEGLTTLSICLLLYYPPQAFKPNIAERTERQAQDPSKPRIFPSLPFSVEETDSECFPCEDGHGEPRRASGSQEGSLSLLARGHSRESVDLKRSSLTWDSPSVRDSTGDTDREAEDGSGNADGYTLCSNETRFESNVCVFDLSIQLSQGLLERSAQAHSLLPGATLGPDSSSKGTMRKMALSLVERRNRWRTIQLLLRRGADPNLCRVPMQALFLAVRAADVDGVKLLLQHGARTDIRLPPKLGALTPLHIAAALPGDEGVKITELLLHAITDVDAQAADQDQTYEPDKLDLPFSSMKLSGEPGPPSAYYSPCPATGLPQEGGRTALHVACEREGNSKCARDIVRLLLSHGANSNLLWSGHSPLSLSIASGNDLVVKELLSQGADPNLPLTRGLGSALCVVCDLNYETQRSTDCKLALIDRLIHHGADILKPVILMQGDKVAVGTAVDYGYFHFFQDRKIAHCPFHALMPGERETLLERKRVLEYLGAHLRRAVFAKESQWDPALLYLSKKGELMPRHNVRKKSPGPAQGPG
nr:ankyrin repeat and MYND domain-containing protein 1 isoform X1 [Microcebus murinus]XP_020143656.1 ankyrin repeat and MYND domain-containing protein 1 isoform X1 [Microcebus murinus]XP_020143657.1 ankyrin repeat and MYND domain-containing protein 1 isoform X1 [Microcebus murinus]XP_020143658.1 ankyrin repeat and MYND domain-containing protein 1 isoform X1 [Microcebus murinus]